MTLPNFLVIGAQRCGTTWLDAQLRKHPLIYMPERRKEIHFFNNYYERGLEWYESFFPSAKEILKYQAIGETTPGYLFHSQVPELIHKHIPDCKLIAIFRNPVERAYSQYKRHILTTAYKASFEEFINQNPGVFARGLYAKQIKRYLNYFSLENILILIFETTILEGQQELNKIADFLALDSQGFSQVNSEEKIGDSYAPKLAKSYALARRFSNWLRANDVDWIVNFAKTVKIPQLFGKKDILTKIDSNIRRELLLKYEEDIAELEKISKIDLSLWKK